MKRNPNLIITALERLGPKGGSNTLDVHRPRKEVLDLLITTVFGDAAIREIGLLVLGALLTGDRQIVRMLNDALKESDHLFRRDREKVLRKKVIQCFPDMASLVSGKDIVAIKKEIEERCNCGTKLTQSQWNRLQKALSLVELPTGRLKNPRKKRP